jgi:hypothetical protein
MRLVPKNQRPRRAKTTAFHIRLTGSVTMDVFFS